MLGTDNIDTIVIIYSKHPKSFPVMIILAKAGSTGNSAILLPNGAKLPKLSNAPKIQSWYIAFIIVYWGGGSIN